MPPTPSPSGGLNRAQADGSTNAQADGSTNAQADGSTTSRRRLACVCFPLFPLQLLLCAMPEWRELPVAVVDEDKPLGTVLFVNKKAHEAGVQVGTRYNTALTVCPNLHVGTVTPQSIKKAHEDLVCVLYRYSPEVELCDFENGVFWVGASGIDRLFSGIEGWRTAMESEWPQLDLLSRTRIGFSRLGTYLSAHQAQAPRTFANAEEELAYARRAPLSLLPFEAKVRRRLGELGLCTVGGFLNLALGSVRRRFGTHAARIHDFMRVGLEMPVQQAEVSEVPRFSTFFDQPLRRNNDILVVVKDLLVKLLSLRTLPFEEVTAVFSLDNGDTREECIVPAQPTRKLALLMRLFSLRLEANRLGAAVFNISLTACFVRAPREQLEFFSHGRKRDPKAAEEALALIRGELGNAAVCYGHVVSKHLPEERFVWLERPTGAGRDREGVADRRPPAPAPVPGRRLPLIRRVLLQSEPLFSSSRVDTIGAPERRRTNSFPRSFVAGPVLVSVYWWRKEIRRAYYLAADAGKRLLWVYYDYGKKQWMLQGMVE